ncbi:sugar phosphate isomerase/epimerase family protein [Paenibacillus sp. NPDC058071]|uniref:sugar phosphate isomerase/epimerase family protein n=1 Tax=Paenibacillus sp. NPDC058071 TaxID=3346326 RepID=UPI0036DD5B5D
MKQPVIAIQMYSLRDLTASDFLGTLGQVAEIGYKAVEFAGYFDTSVHVLKQRLSDLGLDAPSAHVGLNFSNPERIMSDFEAQLTYGKELGLRHIVVPWAPLPEKPTLVDINRLAEQFIRCGEMAKSYGLQFGYHNHEFEFKLVDGIPAIDRLLELVPAELMTMEFDLGWVHVAGYRPTDYLRRYAGRMPLTHFKDLDDGRKDVEIGKGKVGYAGMVNEAARCGVEYIVIEQEQYAVGPLESARLNFDFFKS